MYNYLKIVPAFLSGIKIVSSRILMQTLAGENIITETVDTAKATRNLYIESYGCAMNFSDSEIIASILSKEGYKTITTDEGADVIFLNTCAIRENAESKVWGRLTELKAMKNRN